MAIRKAIVLLAVCCTLSLLSIVALAYPGALNLIPTTDVMSKDSLRLAYEADGKNQPYDSGYTEYIYTQFGVSDKLEVGFDVYDVDGASTKYFNAKYLVTAGDSRLPAVAVGTMLVGSESKPSYYAVGSRNYGETRLHAGIQSQSNRTWGIFGLDHAISDRLCLLADYQSGSGKYHTLGICWEQSPSLGVTLYFVRNNTASLRDTEDYVGLNLAYTISL